MACKRSAANKISCCCVAGTGARFLCKQKLRYLAWVEEYVLFEHSVRLFKYATYIHSDPPTTTHNEATRDVVIFSLLILSLISVII